jgi:beta-N-acetylhexosaminidase
MPNHRSRGRPTLAVAALAALFLTSCSGGAPSAQPSVSASLPSPTGTSPSVEPRPSPTPSLPCAEAVFTRMSRAQRVGQLFAVGLQDDVLSPAEAGQIRQFHFGSVTFIVTTNAGARAVRGVADAVQSLATAAATAQVRFFVAANQEGGVIQALRGPGFSRMPSAVEQGKLSASVLQDRALKWGQELRAAGVDFNFAPVVDVVPPGADAQNQPIGVLDREYGHDPATVATHGLAFLRGMNRAGVATSAKHLPGLGRVRGNTDFAAGVVDRVTTPDDPYLEPFRRAVEAHVPFVQNGMTSGLTRPTWPSSRRWSSGRCSEATSASRA